MSVKEHRQDKGKMVKQQKKKKHIFLKYIVICLVIVCMFIGVKWISDKAAYKEFSKVANNYPFVFEDETNAVWYVTNDFVVPTKYENADGEELKVHWESSDEKYIQFQEDGTAIVNRPETSSKSITVTLVYKKFLGRYEMEYQLNVAAESSVSVEEVDVVTLEELSNQTYDCDMRAILSDDGELDYMTGDFKGTYVNCVEDAQVVLEAYREQFQTPECFDFVLDQVVATTSFINYRFDLCYQGYKVQGAAANITTNKSNGSVLKINVDHFYSMEGKTITEQEWNYNEIIQTYLATNNFTDMQWSATERGTFIYETVLTKEYSLFFENGERYILYINAENGEVMKCFEDVVNCITVEGKTELGKEVEVEVQLIDNSTVNMRDETRNIQILGNDAIYFHGKEEELSQPQQVWNGLGDYWNFAHWVPLDYDGSINSPVEVQSLYYMSNAYDWYKDMFGLRSYDGKGTQITILTDMDKGYDNACWVSADKAFWVYPAKEYEYSVTCNPEVLAHEYTHAVFGSKLSISNVSEELSGFSEAYADVMAFLSTGSTDWIIGLNKDADTGEAVCIRDIANINRDSEELSDIRLIKGNTYPETYMDENWTGDCHNISTVISHVGYEMWSSDLFTTEEVAHIWYDLLSYGFEDNEKFSYLMVREGLLATARSRNCSEEQILFIENAFAGVGIGEYPNVIETKSSAIEGNAFYMPVEDVWSVMDRGTGVIGTVARGTVKVGDEVWLIGMGDEIIKTTVASMDINGTPKAEETVAGMSSCIYLTGVEKEQIQRGMVLIMPNTMWAYTEFTAEITMLPDDKYDEDEILVTGETVNYQVYVTQAEGTVQLQEGITGVAPGETAVVTVKLSVSMAMEVGTEISIWQDGRAIATGVITGIAGVENNYNYVQAEVTSESKEEPAVSSEQTSQSGSGTTFYEERYGFRYAYEDAESGFIYGIAGDEIVLVRYEGEATDVVIPSMIEGKKVTTIAESCFYEMPVTSVVCPETLKVIDKKAFSGCEELKAVTFNEGLERIEDDAFGGTGLEKVILPDTVNYVGDLAFYCDNCITEVKFSASMTELGSSFVSCGATSITVPGNIKVVGYESFSMCNNLKTLIFEEGVEILEEDFIQYCDALESIVIPSTVTEIGDISIYDLDNLVFTVTAGSYAEQYMIENEYAYITK